MEIITHVLTTAQSDLRESPDRQATARKNIAAVSGAKVRGEQENLPVDENGIIEIPSSATVGEGLLTLTDGNAVLGSFNANQATNVTIDFAMKANKVDSATEGNLAGLDENGDLTDSGVDAGAVAEAVSNTHTHANKAVLDETTASYTTEEETKLDGIETGAQVNDIEHVQVDGTELTITDKTVNIDLSGKADKVSGATANDIAGLDANGNLVDTGIAKSAVETAIANTHEHANKAVLDATTASYTTEEETKLDGIETGAQVNDIEHVQVDGTELTIDNKTVNIDLSGKADKVSGATAGNLAGLDENGNPTDSDIDAEDVAAAIADKHTHANKDVLDATTASYTTEEETKLAGIESEAQVNDIEHVQVDGTELTITDKTVNIDLSGKADKIVPATAGNFAGLDSNGNLTDSGKTTADFATAAQGDKADSAIQGVKVNNTLLIKDESNIVNAQIDSIVPPQDNGEWIWSDEKDSSNSMGWRQIVRDYVGNIQRDDLTGEPILDEEGHPITDAEDAADAVELWLRYKGIEFAARRAYADETGENIHTAIHNRTTMEQVVQAIETALANYGGFTVVPLVNGYPDPSPDQPSEKFIYLTKENPSAKTDPYTEWIWIDGTPDGHWECIGETSIDLSDYWHGTITTNGNGNVVTNVEVSSGRTVTVTKGKTVSDGANKVEASSINGNILIDGVETQVCDISGKADKIVPATAGNFAGLDGSGNLTDSGSKAADFATAAQGLKADSAVQGVQKNGTDIALDANKKANVVVNDADFNVKLGSGSAAKVFSADAATASTLVIPLAAADSSSAPTVYTEGLMTGEDKEKLDGITDYVVSASVSGRTLTLTNKNGPDTTFTETGDTNVIESISVNGTAQTVTNKNVDLTIPAAANDATITIEVGGAASGETAPVAGDFSTDQDTAETITIPAAVSATQNTPAQPGVMSSADKEKLDEIEAGAEVNVIESISVNSVPLTPDANKNVDVTVPDAANDATITIEVGGAASGETAPVAGDFSTDQDTAETITIPAAVSATQNAPAQPGVMSSADKEKLDGIEAGAEVNEVETISIGGGTPITPTANTTNIDIPMASYDDSTTPHTYTPGAMDGEDKEKLDNLKNFSQISISDGATPPFVVPITPRSADDTLTLVAGSNITLTPHVSNKTVTINAVGGNTVSAGQGVSVVETTTATGKDYNVSVDGALGFIGGTSTINVQANNCDAIDSSMTAAFTSGNDRFLVDEDLTDHHVYLYALETVAGQTPSDAVNGVDIFTVTFNVMLTRTQSNGSIAHGYYGDAGIRVLRKHSTEVVLAHSKESYASEVGTASINITVTIQNNSGTETTIDGKKYYGYRFEYVGDIPTLDANDDPIETISLTTRLTAIEETVGIAEYNGNIPVYTAGSAIDMTSDVISVNVGDGLEVATGNKLRLKLGEGLKFTNVGGVEAVTIDNKVEEVVEAVEELTETIDTMVVTNMAYSNITDRYDLTQDGSTTGNGVLLGFAFSVPLANKLYLEGTPNATLVTKLGVYAAQVYTQNYIILGLYEYDFNSHGTVGYKTVPLCDTGRVQLAEGYNEFSIKHANNLDETELSLKPGCVYYAAIYISDNCGNGVQLGGCPGYNNAFNSAEPQMSLDQCNINIDLSDSSHTATELDAISFNDMGWGSWSGTQSYHECPSAHRFFLTVRNVKVVSPNP